MNKEEQLELLSRVDIFESLSREEVREILDELLERNAEINLSAAEVFYTPNSQMASSSSSRKAGCASTSWKPQESSPSKW
jgi:predicted HAD superfamily phosphohydrolase